jgi:hypothetical protein
MIFEMKFDEMNETDIREDIISPLLHRLGYKKGTEFDIIRGQSLRYPKNILGLKKKSDPILRGTADYICDVKSKLRWVIEAKSPDIKIGIDDLEQSYSYAIHPEVRAIYYCLCNGRTISFYETMKGAIDKPLLSINYENLIDDFQKIANLVSPEALMRDYPDYQIDVGKPLVPGLRSFAKIIKGSITYESNSWNLPNLVGMTVSVTSGSIERNEDGGIIGYLETLSPFDALQKLNERLGISRFEVFCKDEMLSIHPSRPSVFLNELHIEIPAGERLLDMLKWQEVVTTIPLIINSRTIAKGHYDNGKFLGDFQVEFSGSFTSKCIMTGKFKLYIS